MPFETTKFCFFCGHGPVDLLEYKGISYSCSICKAIFLVDRIKEPQITLEEAQAVFDKIPLTKKKGRNIRYKSKDAPKQKVGSMPQNMPRTFLHSEVWSATES